MSDDADIRIDAHRQIYPHGQPYTQPQHEVYQNNEKINCVLLATEAAAGVGDTQPGAKGEGEEIKGEVKGEKEEEKEQEKEEKAMRS